MTKRSVWHLAREKRLQDRGALPREEGDVIREYKAMHEENFFCSWSKDVGQDKKERWRWTGRLTEK